MGDCGLCVKSMEKEEGDCVSKEVTGRHITKLAIER
jgi:hypothetical protein